MDSAPSDTLERAPPAALPNFAPPLDAAQPPPLETTASAGSAPDERREESHDRLPSSPSGYSLPCPATLLESLGGPTSGVESSAESPSHERTSSPASSTSCDHHPRCHYRSEQLMEAAHIRPWECRWKCRQAEGQGLQLVVPQDATSGRVGTSSDAIARCRDPAEW
ncbi:hypothetical protein JCM10212_006031 [Sporobolomyces blumeae]